MTESWRELNEQIEQERKEKREKIVVLAKNLCLFDYKETCSCVS